VSKGLEKIRYSMRDELSPGNFYDELSESVAQIVIKRRGMREGHFRVGS
jgi:hypothetical protein